MRESLAPQLRPPALTAAITLIVHEAGLHAALGDSSGNVRIAAQVLAFIEPILAISVSRTALSGIRARVLRTRNRGPYCNRGRTAPSASVSLNRAAILSRGRACRADQAQADDGYCTECLHVACSPRRELEPTETVLVRRFTSRCNDPTCSALTPYQWCCPGGSSIPLRQEGGFR
jgi:hypothetical protein